MDCGQEWRNEADCARETRERTKHPWFGEVWDEGGLWIINRGKGIQVLMGDGMNVRSSTMMNPPRITLSLWSASGLGSDVTFTTSTRFNVWSVNPVAKDLIRRMDEARRKDTTN